MRFISLSLLSLVAQLLISSLAVAEIRPGGFEGGFFGGYWEGNRSVSSAGYFGGRGGYHYNRLLTLELSLGATSTEARRFSELNELDSNFESMLFTQLGFAAQLHLSAERLSPYLFVGPGLVGEEDQDNRIAFLAGMGAHYFVSDDVSARFEVGLWRAAANAGEPYEHINVTLGLSYHFGGERDIDGDQIPNPTDRCPTIAEDPDGFQELDGCPDKDNDGDGILDADDQCPDQAEDMDEDRDEDGCPDIDDDNDGIPNDNDRCKDEAEDVDQFQDEDGCPDPDNDNDGIPDERDRCKSTPETMNGYQDEDGCPETDQDGDGRFDGADNCPNQQENYNGYEDEDGCPEQLPEPLAQLLGPQDALRFRGDRLIRKRAAVEQLKLLSEGFRSFGELTFELVVTHPDAQRAAARAEALEAQIIATGVQGRQLRLTPRVGAERVVVSLAITRPSNAR